MGTTKTRGKATTASIPRASRRSTGSRAAPQAEKLLDLSRRLAALDNLDAMIETLIEEVAADLGAERGTLFLNDEETGELYSRYAQGTHRREIHILNDKGIAGHVFTSGESLVIKDAYADPRFDSSIDEQTGFHTRNICCVPVRTVRGKSIGVIQMLNKRRGGFTKHDLAFLQAVTTHAAVALQSAQVIERMKRDRQREMEFMGVVADATTELNLSSLLAKVMAQATRMLGADRSTLFLNDPKSKELFSRIAQGDSVGEIRFPNHLGIAGTVFSTGQTMNIPHAYADLRFNPAFDKQTGYFTRSILCVPITNKAGRVIGVTQVLNKKGGPFTEEDEQRLKAFTSQIAIALENAKLFEDVQNIKNYNESMLESMSAAVLTIDESGGVVTCNQAGEQMFAPLGSSVVGRNATQLFTGSNDWLAAKIAQVAQTAQTATTMDAELQVGDTTLSVNATAQPLVGGDGKQLGCMVMLEDISSEKRLKSTMSRYMDPGLAEQLLSSGDDLLGGSSVEATVLFSDIRSFTTLSEELGPQGTVQFLNDYFTLMVDCIRKQDGMLDKFIGDAVMAAFGIPVAHEDDADRAVRSAIDMINTLWAWNAQRKSQGLKPIDIGVGLNTGTVVSGNIGSPKRMDYTIIGDTVNLASRLESACKQYGARILISENTYQRLRGVYRVRHADLVVVKGKTEPVEILEVLDYHTDETFPNMMDVLEYFREGRRHYREQRWREAITSFSKSLAAHPNDKLAQLYIERCQHFMAEPPPADWNGVWVMTGK